jgi:FKBP-type peptidyl-prolyl cis-trans isomerase SlyD
MGKRYMTATVLFSCFMALFIYDGLAWSAEKTKIAQATVVSQGKTVKVEYTLKVDGKIIDSSKGKKPLEFKSGGSQVVPGFDKAVMGMKVGEKKSFKVSPKDGYGMEKPEAIREIPKSKLPPGKPLKEGMTLYAKGQSGQSLPVRIVKVKKDAVIINFNPPLAGKTLNFDVEVLEIK